MPQAHVIVRTLAVIALAALCWQASARTEAGELFGLQARVQPSSVVFEVRLLALCVRLQADVSGIIVATARLLTCEGCLEAPRARSWS